MIPAIHGDKQQNERDWVLDQFKTGKSPIMVATDVASRGIGESPPSLPSFPWQLPAKHLLYFTLVSRGYLICANLPDVLVSTWFSIPGVLIRCVAGITLAILEFPHLYPRLSRGTIRGGWHPLIQIKLSPKAP